MKYFLMLLLTFLFLSSQSHPQYKTRYNPFSGTMVITVEGGATLEYTDYSKTKIDYLGKTSVDFFLPALSKSTFGIRLLGGGGFISGDNSKKRPSFFRTRMIYGGAGLIYTLALTEDIYPYLSAGALYMWFDPEGVNGINLVNNRRGSYDKKEFNYVGELGIRTLIADNLSININAALHASPNDYLDDIKAGKHNDVFWVASAGLSYAFFTEKDTDEDGIFDSKDLCPETPKGVMVDEFGCPLDSDKDGVADYIDKCSNTPANVKVDENGCPLDHDKDGIPDYLDICPETPNGVLVDKQGCPVDEDKDGVPDYLDKCKHTPAKVEVDKSGCPLDSDGDGVPDYLDECADTPKGSEVDSRGCIVFDEVTETVLSANTNFEFGKWDLLPSAYPVLDNLAEVMRLKPETVWRVEGHTDNVGSDKYNDKLSLDRAQAVVNYFSSKGIDRKRFEVAGLGKKYPVASNETEEGKSQNRRVVILKIN